MEQTTGKRLIELRKAKGLSVEEFAVKLGIKPSAVYGLQSDANKPSFDTLAAIVHTFPDVSMDWLLTGAGEMLRGGAALAKKEPFLPGGEVNSFGATVHPPGGLKALLGEDFGEDIDGKQKAAPLPSDAKGYIRMLSAEIESLKKELGNMRAVVKEQSTVITEQRESLKEQRENAAFLRQQLASVGKDEGSQLEAPGIYTAEPANPIGFGRVRQMWDDSTMVLHSDSTKKAA